MSKVLCWLGLHDFRWPPHRRPSFMWDDFNVECERGCGARQVKRCHDDTHWAEKHPEPRPTPTPPDAR